MLNSFFNNSFRLVIIYAVIANLVMAFGVALFVTAPDVSMPLYMRLVGYGSPAFLQGLYSPSGGGSWSAIAVVVSASWMLPVFVLAALSMIANGVRPDLMSQGIVALGRHTATRGDDSYSSFGFTNGFFVGVLMLGLVAVGVVCLITDKEVTDYAEKKQLTNLSVGGVIEGYRNLVRGAVGVTPAAPASAPARRP